MSRFGAGVDDERTDRKRRTDPTDSRFPTEKNLAGRPSEIIHKRYRRLSRYDVFEMLVRLDMHRVFNELGNLTTEPRRVGSSLRGDVHAISVAGEDYVGSVRTRAHPSLPSAAPLELGQVDGVPSCH